MNIKQLDNIVRFPFDAQSDPFFAALSSALLPILGYEEGTPYWCAPKDKFCNFCGQCGKKTNLQRHALSLYHCLLSATGAAFCFEYPEDDDVDYHSFPGIEKGWRWPDEFIEYIMRLTGLTWKRFRRGADKAEIYSAVAESIDGRRPVMARLGGSCLFGSDCAWQVITGYGDGVLSGLEYNGEFSRSDWYDGFIDALIVTGSREKSVTYAEMLGLIVRTLSDPSHERFEADIMKLIDGVTSENAFETAGLLTGMAGVPIEARWHAGEAFCSGKNLIGRLEGPRALKSGMGGLFFGNYIADNSDETHGVCWKIWGLLGAGPATGYAPTREAAAKLPDAEVKAELKRLWRLVFERDRDVLSGLRKALAETI